jgi:dephospho-CoA kinase
MLRVALTGGIATGKSYCLQRFAARGAATIDADALAREAVAPGSPGLRAVVDRFGADVLAPDGSLDRPALGRLVFARAPALKRSYGRRKIATGLRRPTRRVSPSPTFHSC